MKAKSLFLVLTFSLFSNVSSGDNKKFLNVTNFENEAEHWLWLAEQYNSDLSKIFANYEDSSDKIKDLVQALDVMSKALDIVDILCETKKQEAFEPQDLDRVDKIINAISNKVLDMDKFKIQEFDFRMVSRKILEVLKVIKVFDSFSAIRGAQGECLYLTDDKSIDFLVCLKARKILCWVNNLGIDLGFDNFKKWLEKKRKSTEGDLELWKRKARAILVYLKKERNCLVGIVENCENPESVLSNPDNRWSELRMFYQVFVKILDGMRIAGDNLLKMEDSGDSQAHKLNRELHDLFIEVENLIVDNVSNNFLKYGINWHYFSWFILEDLGEVRLDNHVASIDFSDDSTYLLETHIASWCDYEDRIKRWIENIKSSKIKKYLLWQFNRSNEYNKSMQRFSKVDALVAEDGEKRRVYSYLPMPYWVIPKSPRSPRSPNSSFND